MNVRIIYIILFLFLLINTIFSSEKTLKILTMNVWSGLDYDGICKVGEYESEFRREQRFNSLLIQIRKQDPDIIFLQEVNPAGTYASRLADSLGYDEIHHVCNAGVKLMRIGFPSNLNEGLAILSKPGFELEKYDVWKLSGSPGVNGDFVNFHFDESEYALVGKIKINKVPFYLIDIHLRAAVGNDPNLLKKLDSLYKNKLISENVYYSTLSEWKNGLEVQVKQIRELLRRKEDLPDSTPVIIAGDFNSTPTSKNIRIIELFGGMFSTYMHNKAKYPFTWNPETNRNIRYCQSLDNRKDKEWSTFEKLSSDYDSKSKTIDYIFLNKNFTPGNVISTKVTADSLINGIQPSDHYGLTTEIDIKHVLSRSPKETDKIEKLSHFVIEPLPILNYDSDAGFGYGAKAFLLNTLKLNESFDVIVFNSTKGERWYKFVFSIPDFDLRQFKKYPISIDFSVDYDKKINANFFGIGSNSSYEDRQTYTNETPEVGITFGHAFSREFVIQTGVKYKSVKNSNFSNENELFLKYPQLRVQRSANTSFLLNFRFDTRNNFTNPSTGSVVQFETEAIPKIKFNDANFTKLSLWLQQYFILCYPKTVLAIRYRMQSILGNDIPIQNLLSLGGNSSLRGSPQDRYMDETTALFNSEIRFPIYWRFGGLAGLDAGKVWSSLSKMDLSMIKI